MTNSQVLVLLTYAILMVFIGILPGKIRGKEGFLISARKLHGASGGFTIAASKIGGGLLVTYSTLVFAYGLAAFWLFIGYIIGYFIFYRFAKRLHRESKENKYYTMADYFEAHYGKTAGIVIGILCTVSMAGWIITNLIAGGMLLGEISGWSNVFTTAALAITITAYLLAGGFNAVVRTDIIQYISLVLIAALIAIFFFNSPDIPIETSLLTTEEMPIGKIVVFLLVGIIFPMGSAELWQRVYATDSEGDFLRAITVASVSFIVIGGILSYVCFKLLAANVIDSNMPAELALAVGVSEILSSTSPLLSALWFIAFAAAILSSADTFIYTTASSAVQDVLQRFGIVEADQAVYWIRIAIFTLAILGVIGAILFKSVVAVTFYFLGVSLVLGVVALASWLSKLISTTTLISAAIVGFSISTVHAITKGIDINTLVLALGSTMLFLVVAELLLRIRQAYQSRS